MNGDGDTEPPVILASGSAARRRLLEQAGVEFSVSVSGLDEEDVKASLKAEGADTAQAAETLAELKALRVSRQNPEALVIGADQILTLEETWFDKAKTLEEAAQVLAALSGRRHELKTAICVMRAGSRIWHWNESPALTCRTFSDDFIRHYLEGVGEKALTSVGCYQLESRGVQLFAKIEGDFFAILGLPLLPLLDFLRGWEVVET
jgi:septum formation protein